MRPPTHYDPLHMSFTKLVAGRITRARETFMDWMGQTPEWVDWLAAGIVGAIAMAALAKLLEAALELGAD